MSFRAVRESRVCRSAFAQYPFALKDKSDLHSFTVLDSPEESLDLILVPGADRYLIQRVDDS